MAMPLAPRRVREVVRTVLEGEQAKTSSVSVTFLSPAGMRRLHQTAFGSSDLTDVIAFDLPHGSTLLGDVYVCPAEARKSARALGIPLQEEVIRLLIHGTLHLLGHDHPPGDGRTRSRMWRRQERYVQVLAGAVQ